VIILAFDTSGFSGSVAVLDGSRVLVEAALAAERRSAQTLAPAIADVLRSAQVEARHVRLVATTVGPGSFTGLRVGVTTAKTFAYAVRAEVMGVSTLEAIAQQALLDSLAAGGTEVQAVLDAQRRELFVGSFRRGRDNGVAIERLEADQLMPADAWLRSLRSGMVVTGSGLQKIGTLLPVGVVAVDPVQWQPLARTVGQLAWRDYQMGRRDDLWKLSPVYLRPSYAEEKAARKP
jgi:tRNA threonylcarbamoyladenosine biosynthesis protein TsaB